MLFLLVQAGVEASFILGMIVRLNSVYNEAGTDRGTREEAIGASETGATGGF